MKLENFFNHNISLKEYITGNRFIDICHENSLTFCKTDNIDEYTNTEQKVFVTHNGDYPIDENRFNLRPKNLRKWYCQNKAYQANELKGIPIGLENMTLRVNSTSQLGRFSSQPIDGLKKAFFINDLAKQKIQDINLAYLNINPNTFPSERVHVLNTFFGENWVTGEMNVSWGDYYRQIASHKFVFSPRGNGIDCHRTWEALYLRTIPIVIRSVTMNEFSDLPILFIDKWEDLSYNKLLDFYEASKSKLFDLSAMKITYWKDLIKNVPN